MSSGDQNTPLWRTTYVSRLCLIDVGSPIMFQFSPHAPFSDTEFKRKQKNFKLKKLQALAATSAGYLSIPNSSILFAEIFQSCQVSLCTLSSIWENLVLRGYNTAYTSFSKVCVCVHRHDVCAHRHGVCACLRLDPLKQHLFLIKTKLVNLSLFFSEFSLSSPVPIALHTFCHTVFLKYRPWMN